MTRMFDREPPHSPEAEMSLLGCMILDPERAAEIRLECSPDDFHAEKHATLFRFLSEGCPDLAVLAGQLRTAGVYEQVGGPRYLSELANCVPSTTNWPHYAKAIREKARVRRIIEAASDTLHKAYTSDLGANELAEIAMTRMGHATADRTLHRPSIRLGDALESFLGKLQGGKPQVIPTGLRDFDEMFGGLPTTGLVAMLGVSSSGKSSLILNWLPALVRHGGVRIYSFEMGGENIAASTASAQTRVSLHGHAKYGSFPPPGDWSRVRKFADECKGWDVEVCTDNPHVSEIYRRSVLDARNGVKVVVIDYIQNLPRRPGQDDVSAIAEAFRVLQCIHRELGVLVIAMSQSTMEAARQKQAPKMSDGRGAGENANAPDMIVGVYRPAVWENMNNYEGGGTWEERVRYCELHVSKNKYGCTGAVKAEFFGEFVRFQDREVSVDFPS